MQQKYYRADYGYFKLPVLPGWEEYFQKIRISSENELIQLIEKRNTNENVKKTPTYNPKTIKPDRNQATHGKGITVVSA
jgi:hypothetical protein